jgi:hypothetical protein
MKSQLAGACLLLGIAFSQSGCITHEETVQKDVSRVPIEFENEKAARVFYEAVSRVSSPEGRSESSTKVEIPIVFEHKTRTVRGPNTAFNEAVSRCDTNRDGRITELEANIYSDWVGKK